MKLIKLFFIILIVMTLVGCNQEKVIEDPIIIDDILYYRGFVVDTHTNTIIDYDIEYGLEIELDDNFAEHDVFIVGVEAFKDKGIKSVTINNPFDIRMGAFENNDIETLTINTSEISLWDLSFYNNPIKTINLGDDVTLSDFEILRSGMPLDFIDQIVFSQGFYLSLASNSIVGYDESYGLDVVIPESFIYTIDNQSYTTDIIDNIEIYAFYNKGLTSISFSNKIKEIGPGSFKKNNLTSIDIIDTQIDHISYRAFEQNQLTSFSLDEGVVLSAHVFEDNPELHELTVLTNPDYYTAFYDYISLNCDKENFELINVLDLEYPNFWGPTLYTDDEYFYIASILREYESGIDEDLEATIEYWYYFTLTKFDKNGESKASVKIELADRDIDRYTLLLNESSIQVYIPNTGYANYDEIPTLILEYELSYDLEIIDSMEVSYDTYNLANQKRMAYLEDGVYLVDDNHKLEDGTDEHFLKVYNPANELLHSFEIDENIKYKYACVHEDKFYLLGSILQDDINYFYLTTVTREGVITHAAILEKNISGMYNFIVTKNSKMLIINIQISSMGNGQISSSNIIIYEINLEGQIIDEHEIIAPSSPFNFPELLEEDILGNMISMYDMETGERYTTFSLIYLDDQLGLKRVVFLNDFPKYQIRKVFSIGDYCFVILDNSETNQVELYRYPLS